MKNKIIEIAQKYDADLVGFAPASRFDRENNIFKIMPEVKTVICLAFRILRGSYRCIEEGTTYYQYTTMGVENLEETVMPYAQLMVSNYIEDMGFDALPQRKNPLIMAEEDGNNPEIMYHEIYRGITREPQMDFLNAAVMCGIGEKSFHNTLLTDEFGPFQRYTFILTDAEIEPTPLKQKHLCDNCRECVNACHGNAIDEDGNIDLWRCSVYYKGANGSKNPFMPPDAYMDFEDREKIISGTADIDRNKAEKILDSTYFYPPIKHRLESSICGRACDRACYIHLEKKGVLTKKFKTRFRVKDDWSLDASIFENQDKQGKKQ